MTSAYAGPFAAKPRHKRSSTQLADGSVRGAGKEGRRKNERGTSFSGRVSVAIESHHFSRTGHWPKRFAPQSNAQRRHPNIEIGQVRCLCDGPQSIISSDTPSGSTSRAHACQTPVRTSFGIRHRTEYTRVTSTCWLAPGAACAHRTKWVGVRECEVLSTSWLAPAVDPQWSSMTEGFTSCVVECVGVRDRSSGPNLHAVRP